MFFANLADAQPQDQVVLTEVLTLDRAVDIALQNNLEYNAYKLKLEQSKALISSAFTVDKTTIFRGFDQNNIADNGHPLNITGIEQNFSFPTVYSAQYKVNKSNVSLSEKDMERQKLVLTMNVSKAYYRIIYLMNKEVHYKTLDSLYGNFSADAELRYKMGDISNLELMNAKATHQQVRIALNNIKFEKETANKKLRLILHTESQLLIPYEILSELIPQEPDLEQDPGLNYKKLETQQQREILRLEKNKLLPDINLSFFNGTNRYENSKNYYGYQVGISIPIFFAGDKSRIKAGKIGIEISKNMEENYVTDIKLKRAELKSEIMKYRESLDYYYSTGSKLSKEIFISAQKSYSMGDIDSYQLAQSIKNAMLIEVEYLDWLAQYNDIVLELNYLTMQ
jgi:cobalt-zinc-cadmium resistance protein CzcA